MGEHGNVQALVFAKGSAFPPTGGKKKMKPKGQKKKPRSESGVVGPSSGVSKPEEKCFRCSKLRH